MPHTDSENGSSTDEDGVADMQPMTCFSNAADAALMRKRLACELRLKKQAVACGASQEDALLAERLDVERRLRLCVAAERKLWQCRLLAARERLPIAAHKEAVVATATANRVTILTGATGCGKSTQVPQYLLSSGGSGGKGPVVLVCQLRRVSVASLASRVALERGSALGQEIGFTIGGCSAVSPRTRIRFVTYGVALQLLTSGKLSEFTHVVVDEVHERGVECDLTLALLRRQMAVPGNRHVRLVVMSATMGGLREKLRRYYAGVNEGRVVPFLQVGGDKRYSTVYLDTDAVGDKYLHGMALAPPPEPACSAARLAYAAKLVRELLRTEIQNEESVIVFLPGLGSIEDMHGRLDQVGLPDDVRVVYMHSSVSVEAQSNACRRASGQRTVVLATNIASSSLTIHGLKAVIDFCLEKRNEYDARVDASELGIHWVSQAMSVQRAGRCGRLQAGQCYRLVTRSEFAAMEEDNPPESRRTPLGELCLLLLTMPGKCDVEEVIGGMLDPPGCAGLVSEALTGLSALGLAESTGRTFRATQLGGLVSRFPLSIHGALLVLHGAVVGCFDDAVAAAASLCSARDCFAGGRDKTLLRTLQKTTFAGEHMSDEVLAARVYSAWLGMHARTCSENVHQQWCEQRGLCPVAMMELHDLVLRVKIAGARVGLCEPPVDAIRKRRAFRLSRVEMLALQDFDERFEADSGAKDSAFVADVQLAGVEDETIEAATANGSQLPAPPPPPDGEEHWLLTDSVGEVASTPPTPDAALLLCCAVVSSHGRNLFRAVPAPHAGFTESIDPGGRTGPDFAILQLSHPLTTIPRSDEEAVEEAGQQLIRHVTSLREPLRGGGTAAGCFVLKRASVSMRGKVELCLDPAAGGWKQLAEELVGSSGVRAVQRLQRRVLCGLRGRWFPIPKPLTTAISGRRRASGAEAAQIQRVLLHSSVETRGTLMFPRPSASGVRLFVAPSSVCAPLPRSEGDHSVFGVATRLQAGGGGRILRMTRGTVLTATEGAPDLLALAFDLTVWDVAVEAIEGSKWQTVMFCYSPSCTARSVTLELHPSLLRAVAGAREIGVRLLTELHETFLEKMKLQFDAAEAARVRSVRRKAKRAGVEPTAEPRLFDPSRLPPCTASNPLANWLVATGQPARGVHDACETEFVPFLKGDSGKAEVLALIMKACTEPGMLRVAGVARVAGGKVPKSTTTLRRSEYTPPALPVKRRRVMTLPGRDTSDPVGPAADGRVRRREVRTVVRRVLRKREVVTRGVAQT
eukprot:TRINITY_DN12731_c0_g1_i2.p1 TRINITY_DN12731_c0_g1~~TRINITY_DN12731_c0_g1_i2.p1  ORF type:complete len:1258 (+),score=279.89 TRINITY_DN12731_c0_g1_i2:76-3849(+)